MKRFSSQPEIPHDFSERIKRLRDAKASYHAAPAEAVSVDFAAEPDVVRVLVEGHRLEYGHLFNPAFATEVSLIEPLPHQRIAVYERLLKQAPLRFLLADDAGAGKTIMTGLYIREMLTRKLIRRVLVVPPAGLVGNWERELRTLFSLPFRIIVGSDLRPGNPSPFVGPESDLLIISIDTLAGERAFARLQDPPAVPYDLVIFDEAHKLSADREPDFRIRKTDHYRLAEALACLEVDDERWEEAIPLIATADDAIERARRFTQERLASQQTESHRQRLLKSLPERERFINQGYDYQAAELAETRSHLRDKANAGDPRAKAEMTRIKERQNSLEARREAARKAALSK